MKNNLMTAMINHVSVLYVCVVCVCVLHVCIRFLRRPFTKKVNFDIIMRNMSGLKTRRILSNVS